MAAESQSTGSHTLPGTRTAGRLTAIFVQGLIALLPLAVTIAILSWLDVRLVFDFARSPSGEGASLRRWHPASKPFPGVAHSCSGGLCREYQSFDAFHYFSGVKHHSFESEYRYSGSKPTPGRHHYSGSKCRYTGFVDRFCPAIDLDSTPQTT